MKEITEEQIAEYGRRFFPHLPDKYQILAVKAVLANPRPNYEQENRRD